MAIPTSRTKEVASIQIDYQKCTVCGKCVNVCKFFTKESARGVNMVTYDAPLAMYFYGSPYTDPADPIIAATVAMYAAESMGLVTCMIGSVHPLIQNGKRAKQFREKYKIKFTSREGLIVLFGYPSVKYKKGIRRTFASEIHL